MREEKVRVLRILEYVGSREWVEETLKGSRVPLNGDPSHETGRNNVIKSAIVDGFPEILESKDTNVNVEEEFQVGDYVVIIDECKNVIGSGNIVSINEFREPEFKYAVNVDGYDDFLFVGEGNLVKWN